jgi:hypothetical protein
MIQSRFDTLGALQSLIFRGQQNGADVYLAIFEHGALTWMVQPLVGGKLNAIAFGDAIIRSGTGPSPGTEDIVRQMIAGIAARSPPYDIMLPGLRAAVAQQLSVNEDIAKAFGALKTVTFRGISPRGEDTYNVTYENGHAIWWIMPLTGGKAGSVLMTDAVLNNGAPHPDREASLRRYIDSLESGAPNYDDMTPELAANVRVQLPDILTMIKALGPLQSISFANSAPPDTDVYLVSFEHGKAQWNMGPLTTDGKADRRGFRVL